MNGNLVGILGVGCLLLVATGVTLEEYYLSSRRQHRLQQQHDDHSALWRQREWATGNFSVCDADVKRAPTPTPTGPDNTWQTVTEGDSYVYSAYADPRLSNTTIIRLFGLIRRERHGAKVRGSVEEDDVFWCQVWVGHDKSRPISIKADYTMESHANAKFVSVEWTCLLAADSSRVPSLEVSLVKGAFSACSGASNMLKVHVVRRTGKYERTYTVCLSGALKNDYANSYQLVEWVEVNRMFGAQYFVLYDHNSSALIAPYVSHYRHQGLMETVPWRLPDAVNTKDFDVLWNLGQVTLINDCFYRNMFVSRYVVSVDLDEMIVPYGRRRHTWNRMIQDAGCSNKHVFLVRNAFFGIGPSWPPSGKYVQDQLADKILHLSTLTRTKQDAYVNRFPKRSKYIARTEVVVTAGIHNVKTVWGAGSRNPSVCELDLEYGRLHHYRDPRWKDIELTDNTYMYKYAHRIISRTRIVHNQVLGMASEQFFEL